MGRTESGPDHDDDDGEDDGEEDNNGDNEDNDNNPNVNDRWPSTHPYRCKQLLAGWTAGATDNDDTGIGGETLLVSGEPLRWQQSCCVHRMTTIATRIWGCVRQGTG